ncbi:MAG TPA: MarR family transcriptional regulator [Firmicutes bacterium]|nr:MarR family transcriptional regulator [Bacillota bacterium]
METVKNQVLTYLQSTEEAYKAGEIATNLGLEKADVDKAIKKLKAEDLIISPKRCYYAKK